MEKEKEEQARRLIVGDTAFLFGKRPTNWAEERYPIFGWDFIAIRRYWTSLPDYQSMDTYLNRIQGRYEFERAHHGMVIDLHHVEDRSAAQC